LMGWELTRYKWISSSRWFAFYTQKIALEDWIITSLQFNISHIFNEQYEQVDSYHTLPSMVLHTSAGLIFLLFTGCQPLFKLRYKQKAAKFRFHLKGITESPSYMADTN
jgi:hypothetical protein